MHNVWLIARREYVERIRTRGFMVTTVLIPLLMAAFIFGSAYVGAKSKPASRIAIVSSDHELALDLQAELADIEAKDSRPLGIKANHITVDALDPQLATQTDLDHELDIGALDGYLIIDGNADLAGRPRFDYTPRSAADTSTRATLTAALTTVLMREQLAHRGIASGDVKSLLQPVQIATVNPPRHADPDSALISVTILFFLMYFVIMLYGMNVARSIIEEKTSRIFEVLLATIRPEEMMAGKIIGVGSVGLTQVGIWLAAGLLLASTNIAANLGGESIHIALTASQVVFFIVYFILGYLFYSSIAAALGAMTNSEQELQQLNMFLVLPLAVCFISLRSIITSPDSMFARVLALVPPFTPLLMYLRVSLGHPGKWAILASILLMTASILTIIWVTSRIYRVGVLMYGKRPNIPEILRWLRYS
jgi:ABC-2 type transport system permease protein